MSPEEVVDQLLTPETSHCIVCDSQVDPKDGIVVFEFAGHAVEVFTFPSARRSVWEKRAVHLVRQGATPRWLGNGCHHRSGCQTDNKDRSPLSPKNQ